MKVTNKLIVQKYMTAVAVLAFFMTMSPNASAKHGASNPTPEPASVIAHVPLPRITVRQLDLQQHGSKQYLYLEEVSKDGFAIVDVTKPGQPDVIKSEAWPNEASTGKSQMVSGRLALAEAPDATVETVSRTETVKVLDLSDPANPRTMLTFSGVTSTLADDAHNLVYIANSDGLWILKHQPGQTKSSAHECSSEDASNDLASCQQSMKTSRVNLKSSRMRGVGESKIG
ncbi:MAG: hypothetical protein WCA38_21360 [Candidatus Acidiferrales bacterium]